MVLVHFYDVTLNNRRHPACGAESENVKLDDTFEKIPKAERCPACVLKLKEFKKYCVTCSICGLNCRSDPKLADHERQHILQRTHRLTPNTFVVSCQSFYDRDSVKAEELTRARQELATYREGMEFDFIVSRLEIRKDERNSPVMLGDAYVASYLVVPRQVPKRVRKRRK